MTKTKKSAAPNVAPPNVAPEADAKAEVKARDPHQAITSFAEEFKSFRRNLESRLRDQSRRLDSLDRKATRPPLSTASVSETPHAKAFASYVRQGDEEHLRAVGVEAKGMNTLVAADGGALVDPVTSGRIETVLRGASSIRAIANVVQVEAGAYDALIDSTEMGAEWITESGTVPETATPQIERISVPLHELSANPKASQRLLDDSAFDVEGWLAERIAIRFARTENAAFVGGDGADKPMGFLTHTAIENSAWDWGNLGFVATGEAGAFASTDPGDALVDLVYALPAGYRANASFVMNSKTAGEVRKLKDTDGRYLWVEGLGDGLPARLLGYPVVIAEDMPDIAADSLSIAFGDFRAGYTIAERPDVRLQRDPYSAKPHVLFYATKRVGGDVTDFAAIKLLKFAA